MIIGYASYSLYMVYASVIDIKRKGLYSWELLIGSVLALCVFVSNEKVTFGSALLGAGLGAFFMLVSWISKGQLGIADSIILIQTGVGFGLKGNIIIVGTSLLLVAIFSGILMIIGRLNRKSKVPYLPFVLIGVLIYCFTS